MHPGAARLAKPHTVSVFRVARRAPHCSVQAVSEPI
jgi:hypothetical protein